MRVYPDLIVAASADVPQFIIDAKYKTNAQKGPMRISENDTYEAMAFAKASLCETVVLAYPASHSLRLTARHFWAAPGCSKG